MVFFILVVAAVIGIAVYVSKKTKSKPTSFLAPGETLTADAIEEIPTEPVVEATPEVVVEAPKMDAKPKKKPQPKKKPATKVNA